MQNVTSTSIPQSTVLQLAKDVVAPLLIGSFINLTLFGMLILQTLNYFRHAKNDQLKLKLIVGALTVTETWNTLVVAFIGYQYTILYFGDVQRIVEASVLFEMLTMSCTLSSCIVQSFFALRVKWLTGQIWLPYIIIVAAIFQFGCGVTVGTVGVYRIHDFARLHDLNPIIILWLTCGVLNDIAISASLVHYLHKHQTGFQDTDDLIGKIIRAVVQTGAITVVWSIIDLTIFLVYTTNLHFVFTISLAKLYANCMLSSLNARSTWIKDADRVHELPIPDNVSGIKVTLSTSAHHDEEMQESKQFDEKNIRVTREHSPIAFDPSTLRRSSRRVIPTDGLSLNSSLADPEDGAEDNH
ncbi:hypothetical protein DL93DRAFT_2079695 [Clavulina sp. PMI_390]|nr:hypothetical protein DL93DRAFT_2079695 [Clavulina sp. PMI_390]